jgi:hypothetical protein
LNEVDNGQARQTKMKAPAKDYKSVSEFLERHFDLTDLNTGELRALRHLISKEIHRRTNYRKQQTRTAEAN